MSSEVDRMTAVMAGAREREMKHEAGTNDMRAISVLMGMEWTAFQRNYVTNAPFYNLVNVVAPGVAVLRDLVAAKKEYDEAYAADLRLDEEPIVEMETYSASSRRVKDSEEEMDAAWDRARALVAGEEKG